MNDPARLMRLATYAATFAALVLIAAKLWAWTATGSVAILTTLTDSILDAAASLVNLFAVRFSLLPADHDHRFGHGKAEPLAGLTQAAFIAGSGVLLLIESSGRFLEPEPVTHSEIGIGVMIFSIVITLALVSFQKYVIKKSNSVAITADSLHYTGDVLINFAVIISILIGVYLGWLWIDPLFGSLIACYLIYNAWQVARESLDLLMDKEFSREERRLIETIAHTPPEVLDVHDLRTRSSGRQRFIQLHLVMDGSFTLTKAHDIADAVEREIQAAFPEADVIIHQDPAGIDEVHPKFE